MIYGPIWSNGGYVVSMWRWIHGNSAHGARQEIDTFWAYNCSEGGEEESYINTEMI